jgi:hypothetical protein
MDFFFRKPQGKEEPNHVDPVRSCPEDKREKEQNKKKKKKKKMMMMKVSITIDSSYSILFSSTGLYLCTVSIMTGQDQQPFSRCKIHRDK